jgi:ERCC4-related helicase
MTRVFHPVYGIGYSISSEDGITVVRFTNGGLRELPTEQLSEQPTPEDRMAAGKFDATLALVTRLQAHAIRSIQDRWGVFSRSRIQLLPHQLWTCQQVMRTWPPRWLVADDVGLGKTIEAGLILQAAKSQGRLSRLLILCPASLTGQWKQRLLTMFDIRCEVYSSQGDRPKDDFWRGETRRVIASFHTLRDDDNGRWQRLKEADPFDLVVFDEAHHIGSDTDGVTRAYRLVEELQKAQRIKGLLFFTGTPHKGKDYGFLNLLRLLRPEQFNPKQPLESHLGLLPSVMIRNSKANATDLHGNTLFQGTTVHGHEFPYNEAEQLFYDRLTTFIERGLLFSGGMDETNQRAVGLVLASLQKLAASSVAAIAKAIRGRLQRLREQMDERKAIQEILDDMEDRKGADTGELEERLAELDTRIALVEDEQPFLENLLELAGQVHGETKIRRIIELVKTDLTGRSVLFFTEYKATQSLLMNALMEAFGRESVGFINGDGRAEGLLDAEGNLTALTRERGQEAEKFNKGEYRFLVSTEAAGEGIDLQQSCHTLVHVDLPWNPMRLHQRVGRLYRYGQVHPVDVHKFYNPGTVEARIHALLEEKLKRITLAFGEVMQEEREDMLQVVLGMADPGFFQGLFQKGLQSKGERLEDYLERLAPEQVVATTQALVGSVAQFDFQGFGKDLPRVDLPDLKPFLQAALALHGREWQEQDHAGGFITPVPWRQGSRGLERYDGLHLNRGEGELKDAMGADHIMMREALKEALGRSESLGLAETRHLPRTLHVFRIFQRTATESPAPDSIFGIWDGQPNAAPLRDWEVLLALNPMAEAYRVYRQPRPLTVISDALRIEDARKILEQQVDATSLGIRDTPGVEWLGSLVVGYPTPD